jgi:predicted RNA-binding Zn-ribbon protein involved in translation (DUF1610 family)
MPTVWSKLIERRNVRRLLCGIAPRWSGTEMRCTKRQYLTEGHATAACKSETKSLTKSGAGAQAKFLEAYACPHCGFWHIGRSWKSARRAANQFVKPAPQSKMPSTGDLRRKLERMQATWERHDDYQRRQRAAAIGKLVAAERAVADAETELRNIQREVIGLFLPQ